LDAASRHAREVVPQLSLDWLAREERPRLIVNRDLEILWANPAGRAALSGRRDLENRDGQLAATNPAHHDALAGFVRDAGAGVAMLALPSDDGKGHLLMQARQVGRGADGPRVGILFFHSHHRVFEYADFSQVFGLTRAEHQVLLLMLEGQTADEVSSRKKVSIDTVRSQIRQIYDKLGVSSREGLFRRIRPYIL
jgi:DNA-binding CsgD family transcriptional regulator